MRYIMNSCVITSPGTYTYELISVDDAVSWLQEYNLTAICTIAYEETCQTLALLTGFRFSPNRRQTRLLYGEEALVFRLTCRLSDPKLKGKLTPEFVLKNSEIGILRRIN